MGKTTGSTFRHWFATDDGPVITPGPIYRIGSLTEGYSARALLSANVAGSSHPVLRPCCRNGKLHLLGVFTDSASGEQKLLLECSSCGEKRTETPHL